MSRHAEICQFDCFSLEINFKIACSCNYGIPRLGSSKKCAMSVMNFLVYTF